MKHRKLNKSQKRLFNVIKNGYDWDWAYLLTLEKAKLQNMSEHFTVAQIFIGWEYVVSKINLCIRLIDIIIDDSIMITPRKVNLTNVSRFFNSSKLTSDESRIKERLYIEKANHLYYEIRKRYTRYWWD